MKNEYLLLTPGPLSTSETVREAMLKDWCTWDDEYNKDIVEVIRAKLTQLVLASSLAKQETTNSPKVQCHGHG